MGTDIVFLTAVLEEQPWNHDSKVIPLPWRSEIQSGGLNVGYHSCDGVVCIFLQGRGEHHAS